MSTPTEPNSADRALANDLIMTVPTSIKLSVTLWNKAIDEWATHKIAAHRSAAVAEAVAKRENQADLAQEVDDLKATVAGLADSADKVRGRLEDERDSLKAQVVRLKEALEDLPELYNLATEKSCTCYPANDCGHCGFCSAWEKADNLASTASSLVPADLADSVALPRTEWQAAKDRIDELIDKNIEGAKQNSALESENKYLRQTIAEAIGLLDGNCDPRTLLRKAALQPSEKGGT